MSDMSGETLDLPEGVECAEVDCTRQGEYMERRQYEGRDCFVLVCTTHRSAPALILVPPQGEE